MSRIQAGEIPYNYSSSKDILSNIKSTAVKVAGGSLKYRSSNNTDQTMTTSTPNTSEYGGSSHYQGESDSHYNTATLTVTPPPTSGGASHNNQNSVLQTQFSNSYEPAHSSLSSSASNEIGNSQFYIDSSRKFSDRRNLIKIIPFSDEHIYDSDKSNRKHDTSTLPGRYRFHVLI